MSLIGKIGKLYTQSSSLYLLCLHMLVAHGQEQAGEQAQRRWRELYRIGRANETPHKQIIECCGVTEIRYHSYQQQEEFSWLCPYCLTANLPIVQCYLVWRILNCLVHL